MAAVTCSDNLQVCSVLFVLFSNNDRNIERLYLDGYTLSNFTYSNNNAFSDVTLNGFLTRKFVGLRL